MAKAAAQDAHSQNLAEKQEEARKLAQEAVAEMRDGNAEEGKFLAQEAESLDRKSADEVLKSRPDSDRKAGL